MSESYHDIAVVSLSECFLLLSPKMVHYRAVVTTEH